MMASEKKILSYGLHWFRRDLRINGNGALKRNIERNDGRVLGIFFFDSKFLSRPDFSHHRFAFFIDTLISLKQDLLAHGGDLLVLDHGPDQGFKEIIKALTQATGSAPSLVTYNRDYEPFARERDLRIQTLLEKHHSIEVFNERDHLILEPNEIEKDESGGYYQVYSPFARRWFEKLKTNDIQSRIQEAHQPLPKMKLQWNGLLKGKELELDCLKKFQSENMKKVTIPIPKAGVLAAQKCLAAFKQKVEDYKERRDIPSEKGTSQISIFLKNGSLTTAQVIQTLKLEHIDGLGKTGPSQYVKELAWREFYYHILWHCPRVETEAFLTKYNSIEWENRKDFFEAWKEGKTGYPIVDAGMRQLKQTGWMHNRVRMIVASFLTKDLLIDWKWGEKYFMEQLLDGDLAPNNGGWQWAASTGCDPQPYFRVFNPMLQSKKFDPDGAYIKRWLPERAKQSGESLHEPIDPIVDHDERRKMAIALYKI